MDNKIRSSLRCSNRTSLRAGRKGRNPESVFEKGALSHAHELKGALVSVDLSPSIGLLPPFVSSTRILLVIIKPRLTNAAFSTRLPLADAANKHCCDSRGVKPDIRHPPRLTCLSPFFFIAWRLTPPTRPPLLIRSLSLSGWLDCFRGIGPLCPSVPRSPAASFCRDCPLRPPRVMRLEYGRCSAPPPLRRSARFWYRGRGTPVTCCFSPPLLSLFFWITCALSGQGTRGLLEKD